MQRAVARGGLSREVETDAVFDVLSGPLSYRVIVRRERATRQFGESLVDALITNLASGSRR